MPAHIARLADQGRPLAVGEPANVVLVDPGARRVVDRNDSASLSRNNPWHGRELRSGGRHHLGGPGHIPERTVTLGFILAMATPTSESAPPTIARIGGTSLRKNPSRMVIGGTAKVVTPSFPAAVWLSAYAQVEKASAVGTSPR